MTAQPAISQQDVETIISGITIPTPPQLIADLQMEMALPDPDLNEIAQMINKDVGLAGGIIKTVNSPFYGQHDISSISKAVMMLGMNTVMNIVNALYLKDSMAHRNDISDGLVKHMTRFWDMTNDVAQSCVIIAKHIRCDQTDMAYMLGLFHNAGIPLLMLKYPDYPAIMEESYLCQNGRIVDTENKYLNTNHAVLSWYIAQSWKLPKCICAAIAKHHSCEEIFTDDSIPCDTALLLSILKLAEHLAKTSQILGNQPIDYEWEHTGDNVMNHLGINQHDYEDLVGYAADMGIGNPL